MRPRTWGAQARANDRTPRGPSHRKVSAMERIRRWSYDAGWRACGNAVGDAIESAARLHIEQHGHTRDARQQMNRAAADAALARSIGRRPQ